jgi:hypothetical protein
MDICEKLFVRKAVGAALNCIGPGFEIHPHSVDVLIVRGFFSTIRIAMAKTRRNVFVDIASFLSLDIRALRLRRVGP